MRLNTIFNAQFLKMKTQPYHSVRTSKIHGRGVFARRPMRKGTKILEYTGPIITQKQADKIGAQSENGHTHTMLFQVDEHRVINGLEGGDARYINHSCDPNCEAVQYEDKIFIEALKSIKTGEELLYDYHLQVQGKITDAVRKEYACFCGASNCRGTQIAPEILEKQAKKDEKKRKAKEEKAAAAVLKQKKKEEQKAAKEAKKEKKKTEKKATEKLEKRKGKSVLVVKEDTSRKNGKKESGKKKDKKNRKKGK